MGGRTGKSSGFTKVFGPQIYGGKRGKKGGSDLSTGGEDQATKEARSKICGRAQRSRDQGVKGLIKISAELEKRKSSGLPRPSPNITTLLCDLRDGARGGGKRARSTTLTEINHD